MVGHVLRRTMPLLGLLFALWAHPPALAADATLTLPARGAIELEDVAHALLARSAAMSPEKFLSHPAARGGFGSVALDSGNELWARLTLRNPEPRAASWSLQLAVHSADSVTLHQRLGEGWAAASAGDHVPISQWPQAARYPTFPVHLQAGEERTVVLQMRNAFPVPAPLRIASAVEAHAQEDAASIGFGLILGAFALLVASCLLQAALHGDLRYFLYAAFSLLLGLSFAALSGIAGQHLWGDFVPWTDAAKSVLPLAAAGVFVWLVSALCSLRTRSRALRRTVVALGALVILAALACAAAGYVPRWVVAGGFAVGFGTALAVAFSTFRRGDPIGGWVLAAFVPVALVTALVVARSFGMVPFYFYGARWLAIAIALMLPLLMMALHLRTKETMALQSRERDLGATDALTGLLGPALFADRVRAAVARFERSGHDAVVLYVRVANYSRIREVHGAAIADQSMIRCAIRVQRLMSEADCIGRVAEDTIALILEYDTDRSAVQERAAQLIAHGLMAPKGLRPELILQLHVAANVLSAHPIQAAAMHESLTEALRAMSARRSKPIRFLEPPATDDATVPEEADPELPATA